jgi:hypothetical protein
MVASAAADAGAVTLRLAFPDGQPMTHGSACAGLGCLANGRGAAVDERGEVDLPDFPRTVEWRREGISLPAAPIGVASGTVFAVGDRASATLPRLLVGSTPVVDATESDLVARLNEARAGQGLPLAQINPRLSSAADMQATWLRTSGATVLQPDRFHVGPFGTDLTFRHGEVSLPDPDSGGEIAEAGATADQTVSDWLSSAEHRRQVLAPGPVLVGIGQAGPFTIVQTHRPCAGCVQAGTGTRLGAPAPPPAAAAAGSASAVPAPAPTIGSSDATTLLPACGRERLTAQRLQKRHGLVRMRVSAQCLRRGARYVLMVRQNTAGRVLKTLRITRAGTSLLALRAGPSTKTLRMRLKRDGHVVVVRTMALRTGVR